MYHIFTETRFLEGVGPGSDVGGAGGAGGGGTLPYDLSRDAPNPAPSPLWSGRQ